MSAILWAVETLKSSKTASEVLYFLKQKNLTKISFPKLFLQDLPNYIQDHLSISWNPKIFFVIFSCKTDVLPVRIKLENKWLNVDKSESYKTFPKNFLLLVLTILPHWCKISSLYLVAVSNYWTWTKTTSQKKRFFW